MSDKINIFLTIDLECRRKSISPLVPVYGKTSSNNEFYGLEFILKTFKKYDLKATFFVEPFFSYRFGLDVLKEVCNQILNADHDIQLHIHPFFKSTFNDLWEDKLYVYNLKDQVSLINEAKGILLKCGVKKIDAFRAGSFAANNNTYEALKQCGIRISSNYNLDYLRKSCKINIIPQHNDVFCCKNGILEVPITCFNEFNILKLRKNPRHMQITAVSFLEMKYVINNAENFGLRNIVILFHTFEFIRVLGKKQKVVKKNHINIERFLYLCKFLSKNRDKFIVKKISDIKRDIIFKDIIKKDKIIKMPLAFTFVGKFEQIRKRILR